MAEKSPSEEKIVVIPLRRKRMKSPRNMRMNRSVSAIRLFLSRHMRAEPSKIHISQQLNESLWKGGVHNPPSRIKIKVSRDEEGKVFARLVEEREKPKSEKKKLGLRERLARRRETAREEKKEAPEKEEKKPEKPAAPEPKKEKPKEETPELFEDDLK